MKRPRVKQLNRKKLMAVAGLSLFAMVIGKSKASPPTSKGINFMRTVLVAALLCFAAPAFAQHQGHGSHGMAQPSSAQTDSTKAYEAANDKMHRDMAIKYTGDADRDFLAGMIPHHQGAIDMAKVVLRYGKDPKIKAMAEKIIKDQEAEIAEMKAMLAK